ncbi:transcription elongation factor, mitochondrial [Thomomys bottae]
MRAKANTLGPGIESLTGFPAGVGLEPVSSDFSLRSRQDYRREQNKGGGVPSRRLRPAPASATYQKQQAPRRAGRTTPELRLGRNCLRGARGARGARARRLLGDALRNRKWRKIDRSDRSNLGDESAVSPPRGSLGRWRCFPVLLESALSQALRSSFCCREKSTLPEQVIPSVAACDANAKETTDTLDKLFSAEQQASVLHVLNTASTKELEVFKLLRGKKSINIIAHREKFGPFQNLESLKNVPLFQHKTALTVCNSILCPGTRKEKKTSKEKPQLGRLIKPRVERERLKAVDSIVSIVCGTRRIAWAHLDRNLTVLNWQQSDCWNLTSKMYPSSFYLEQISSVISKMPEVDFYVLEKIGLSMQNSSLFPVLLHLHIMEAMLYALLNRTFAQDGQHHVLNMHRGEVGKHFQLMVGPSRTSGKELVKQLLSDSILNKEPRVSFPLDKIMCYRQMISASSTHRQEELYDSLLQAIAFFELAVFDTEP